MMSIKLVFIFVFVWLGGALGSALHGPCETDDDCGTIDTICYKGVCACRENFAVWYDSCVPLANPRVTCSKKQECHKALGIKSMCTKKNQCACKAFHHLHNGQCVKNRDLHDLCDHDRQCYCGADCQEKIACIHKNCSCRAGHSPYKSRRCISDQPMVLTVADQQIQHLEETTIIPHPIKETIKSVGRASSVASKSKFSVYSVLAGVLFVNMNSELSVLLHGFCKSR
ncbi:uncharacterized protein [Euwallacea fornicatus]|uniref:uncharacterized protein n=1 Tax=Euwallacea fornicatus TaxID=995702 RepID=UPI00338EB077